MTIGVSSCPRGDAPGILSGALDAAAACCVALKALAREVLISCSLMAQPRALQREDNSLLACLNNAYRVETFSFNR